MSDIVERLREMKAKGWAYRDRPESDGVHCAIIDAANEITRLRTALADERKLALEEAAKALDAWGDIYGDNAAKTVRSQMEPPK